MRWGSFNRLTAGLLLATQPLCFVIARTAETSAIKIDTRDGVRELRPRYAHFVIESARLSTVWDVAVAGTFSIDGIRQSVLGANAEADVNYLLSTGDHLCEWNVGSTNYQATFRVINGAKAIATECVKLDLRESPRISSGHETLRYSTLWDGGTNMTARVSIAQNGTTLIENLANEGNLAWSVTQNGTYNLTHTTYSNGVMVAALTTTFIVTGKTPVKVSEATARQRYPWNGMVDLAFTITGEAGTSYQVSFAAKDVAGGTNIVMKTVWEEGKPATSAASPYLLKPGIYRFVWNAGADLPDGTKFDRVAITVEVR